MILIYDHDDRNITRVANKLKESINVKEILLNLPDQNINISHSTNSLVLLQNETQITEDDFFSSKFIIFFRWKMKNQPFVKSTLKKISDKRFAEREWTSLLLGILLYYEDLYPGLLWINRPSLFYNQSVKYWLLCRANKFDFAIPKFIASNKFQKITGDENTLITKSISSDEQIDSKRYFFTTKLNNDFISQYANRSSICPSFLQRYIKPKHELRIYYLLGFTLTLMLRTNSLYSDIRELSKSDIEIEEVDCPKEVKQSIDKFCESCGLSYCCFDFVYNDGQYFLLDITPNGSWEFFKNDKNPEISIRFSKILLNEYNKLTINKLV